MSILVLPGDPEFNWILQTARPPNWQEKAKDDDQYAFVGKTGSGIVEAVNRQEFDEYVYGGEYDERLEEIGDDDDFEYEFDWK